MEVGTYNYIRVNFFVEDGNKSQSKTRQPTIVNHIFKNPSLMHSPANTSHFIQPTVQYMTMVVDIEKRVV